MAFSLHCYRLEPPLFPLSQGQKNSMMMMIIVQVWFFPDGMEKNKNNEENEML